MSASYVSAVVAGVAVAVSGLLQFLTLRRSKRDSAKALAAAERTARMTALSTSTTVWEQGLREDLAEFATLVYEVENAHKSAMLAQLPWPGTAASKVSGAETVFNRIRLRLDPEVLSERDLIDALNTMRNNEIQLWSQRREALFMAARQAFQARWSQVLGDAV